MVKFNYYYFIFLFFPLFFITITCHPMHHDKTETEDEKKVRRGITFFTTRPSFSNFGYNPPQSLKQAIINGNIVAIKSFLQNDPQVQEEHLELIQKTLDSLKKEIEDQKKDKIKFKNIKKQLQEHLKK